MITVRQKKVVIENTEKKLLYYPDLFTGPIITEITKNLDDRSISSLAVGLAMVTQKIYKPRIVDNQSGSIACIILQDEKTFFEKGKEKIEVVCQPGSVLILGSEFRREWKYELPETSIKLYEDNYLPGIYLNSKQRFAYAEKVKRGLDDLRKLAQWKQCVQKNMQLELLGKGSYANVFKSGYSSQIFAIKLSKIKPESIEHPYDISFASWHEVYFLRDIFKPLIAKNICPNLPLLYDTFTCNSCDLVVDDEKINTPCVITVMEIASGNLKQYLQEKRKIEEVKSALFQIMAAIHAIQYYAQIMNFDVKKENILYYDVEAGGYWQYIIKGKKYYVPNFGKLFVLNDFGISRPMSPKFPIYKTPEDKTFRLGSRYAIVKDGKFVPLDVMIQRNEDGAVEKPNIVEWENGNISLGAEFRMERKNTKVMKIPVILTAELEEYLEKQNITIDTSSRSFFQNPEIIPPFEFYNDTQDAIRMFTGGKRTTQKGNHKEYSTVPKKFIKELAPYLGKGESHKDRIFSDDPAQVLAGYFIQSFFAEYRDKPQDGKIIATYTISM